MSKFSELTLGLWIVGRRGENLFWTSSGLYEIQKYLTECHFLAFSIPIYYTLKIQNFVPLLTTCSSCDFSFAITYNRQESHLPSRTYICEGLLQYL